MTVSYNITLTNLKELECTFGREYYCKLWWKEDNWDHDKIIHRIHTHTNIYIYVPFLKKKKKKVLLSSLSSLPSSTSLENKIRKNPGMTEGN